MTCFLLLSHMCDSIKRCNPYNLLIREIFSPWTSKVHMLFTTIQNFPGLNLTLPPIQLSFVLLKLYSWWYFCLNLLMRRNFHKIIKITHQPSYWSICIDAIQTPPQKTSMYLERRLKFPISDEAELCKNIAVLAQMQLIIMCRWFSQQMCKCFTKSHLHRHLRADLICCANTLS